MESVPMNRARADHLHPASGLPPAYREYTLEILGRGHSPPSDEPAAGLRRRETVSPAWSQRARGADSPHWGERRGGGRGSSRLPGGARKAAAIQRSTKTFSTFNPSVCA
jgi:hypothetical protein